MIEARKISKAFKDQKVLDEVSVDFDHQGVAVILGISGAGKSTLLRCINGLEEIDTGELLVDGLSVRDRRNLKQIRMKCGMVFQQTVLFPHMNVLENVTLSPIKLLKKSKKEAVEAAMEFLNKVGLSAKAKSFHNQLSGGEMQRVAIARALAMSPRALLLDEITSSLDPEMTADVLRILEKLAGEGVVMLIVSHELNFARKVSDRILFLEGGKIISDTDTESFFTTVQKDNERIGRFLKHLG